MIAVPIALALFGYWVLYAGLKGSSLLDAYRCSASSIGQTQGDQSGRVTPGGVTLIPSIGGVTPSVRVATDCRHRPGDIDIPIPGTTAAGIPDPLHPKGHMIWRPIGSGILGQLNGQLIGPCP